MTRWMSRTKSSTVMSVTWSSSPRSSASARAYWLSSYCAPIGNRPLKAIIPAWPASAASAATMLESSPPLRYAPIGHVGPQVDADRVLHPLLELLLEVARGVVVVGHELDVPVALLADGAAGHRERVPGRQLANALEQGLAIEAELEGQVVAQAVEVGFDRRQEREQRLGFRGEQEGAVHDRVVERLHPEPIPSAEQRALVRVPQGKGEHAAQVGERVGAPLLVGPQDHLGVRGRPERPRAQLVAQLDVVVDLVVGGDPVPVLALHRLVTGGRGR